MRELKKEDFDKGFMDLLEQLSITPKIEKK